MTPETTGLSRQVDRTDPAPGVPLPQDEAERSSAASQKQVLMVDDERLVLRLGCKILEQLGAIPTGVLTGEEGIQLATNGERSFDLMLLDLMLEDMTGFDVYEQVRAKRPLLPIIFISGFCSQEALAETLQSDARTAFVAKPFSMKHLLDTMSDF